MQIICTSTNAWVAGLPAPYGSYEFPLSGQLGIVTPGIVTNFYCGTGDTLFLTDSFAYVSPGWDVYDGIAMGLIIACATFGLAAVMRQIQRKLHWMTGVTPTPRDL